MEMHMPGDGAVFAPVRAVGGDGCMSEVVLSQAEIDAIEVLADYLPEPGTRCPTCNRRVNKPRQDDSPAVREMRFRGPNDLIEPLEEGIDALQEFTRVDPYAYPRARLLEALLVLGAQHREELKAYFEGRE